MKDEINKFIGFPSEMKKNFWMYPRVMDNWWYQLSGSEQKCLDFILRRLWGWEKSSDRISLSQIQKGGGKIGGGTGLSQRQIITSIKGLERKGFIVVEREFGMTNKYSLVVQEVHRGSEEIDNGSSELSAKAGSEESSYTVDKESIERKINKMYILYSNII